MLVIFELTRCIAWRGGGPGGFFAWGGPGGFLGSGSGGGRGRGGTWSGGWGRIRGWRSVAWIGSGCCSGGGCGWCGGACCCWCGSLCDSRDLCGSRGLCGSCRWCGRSCWSGGSGWWSSIGWWGDNRRCTWCSLRYGRGRWWRAGGWAGGGWKIAQNAISTRHFDILVIDSSISRALAMEMLQPCTKPYISSPQVWPLVNGTINEFANSFVIRGNFIMTTLSIQRFHYSDVIKSAMTSQIVCSTAFSGADQRKHQSSASLVFVRGNNRSPVDSPHKGPVTQKMLPFDDVIMLVDGEICQLASKHLLVPVMWSMVFHSIFSRRTEYWTNFQHTFWQTLSIICTIEHIDS